jgi:transposase
MTGNQSKKRYPAELKERAVKMTLDLQRGDPGDHGVMNRVSRQLGIGSKSLRNWVKGTEIDTGARGALTSA